MTENHNPGEADMNTDSCQAPTPRSLSDLLAQVQAAFEQYRTQCFWFMNPRLVVTEETLPRIIKGLLSHGDRRAYVLGRQLAEAARTSQANPELSDPDQA